MKKILVLAALAFAAATSSLAPAAAAPFSAVATDGSTIGSFQNLAQCQAYLKGLSGTCIDGGSDWSNAQARQVLPTEASSVARDMPINPHR